MYELTIRGDFAAAHSLRGYEGKCKNLHGHTWRVEVVIKGEELDTIGMVVDFALLKKQLKEFLNGLDHVHLNELAYFQRTNPTTENIAKYIYEEFPKRYPPHVLSQVRVWESDHASVTYYR